MLPKKFSIRPLPPLLYDDTTGLDTPFPSYRLSDDLEAAERPFGGDSEAVDGTIAMVDIFQRNGSVYTTVMLGLKCSCSQ